MKFTSKLFAALLGCMAFFASPPSAMADDSEIFSNSGSSTAARPNVLFIIDTSGSMSTLVSQYDSSVTYTDVCGGGSSGRIYWSTNNSAFPPDCRDSSNNHWISAANNRCYAAANGMATDGWWNGKALMLYPYVSRTRTPSHWDVMLAGVDRKVECSSDKNVHGDLPGTTSPGSENKYPRNGSETSGGDADRWGNRNSGSQVRWTDVDRYSFYSVNYINWYYGGGGSTTLKSRLDIVRDVAKNLIDRLDGVNLGLMRYDEGHSKDRFTFVTDGGMVTYPVSELTPTSRTELKAELDTYVANGFTPLSETMYEAHQYLSGGSVYYGNASAPEPSAAGSRTGGSSASNTYDSPMDYSCQNTFIVYLTDGLPTQDTDAETNIKALPNFGTDGGTCPNQIPNSEDGDSGRCLEPLARYMHNHDLRSDVAGKQTVTTYFIGFGDDVSSSADWLETVAAAGGGRAYTQTDAAGLTGALESIFDDVVKSTGTTFVAPSVAVNAFNRTQNLNALFVSVFAPSSNRHWPGNLKKYKFINGDVYGQESGPAVDPNGSFFNDDAKALNTDPREPADGANAKAGGAASRIPYWDETQGNSRNVYSNLDASTPDLTSPNNAFKESNTGYLTNSVLGAVDDTQRSDIIEFARGRDVNDEDGDNDREEARMAMGDPMHARPAVVIYSGTAASPVGVVYTPTNDGFLHAFDMGDASGTTATPSAAAAEKWAFIPYEYLPRQRLLLSNSVRSTRDYALDGDIRVFKFDADQDGVIDSGDEVYLFFGAGRGGSYLYSLDVTNPNAPKFRWKLTPTELPGLGKAWSTPTIARVNIAGSGQSTDKYVLIMGGGYDTAEEGYDYTTDSVGNAIYMIDIESGALLWSASSSGGSFTDANMTHAFPSSIVTMDLDQDGFTDRMYAADVGGRVWRFDITNGNTAANLVTGGVLASLGGAAVTSGTPTRAQTRRFYNTPSVSPIAMRGARPFINIALGSGYRGHPLNTETRDRFYSIRDYQPFTKRTTASYATGTILDTSLVDITDSLATTVPDGQLGWKLELRSGASASASSWVGEKVLADATTAQGVVFFTTFTPLDPTTADPCHSPVQNKIYAMNALNGKPFARLSDTGTGALTISDRSALMSGGGIAPGLNIFADPIGSDTTGGGSSSGGSSSGSGSGSTSSGGSTPTDDDEDPGKANCMSALYKLKHCVSFGDVNRSFWEHR